MVALDKITFDIRQFYFSAPLGITTTIWPPSIATVVLEQQEGGNSAAKMGISSCIKGEDKLEDVMGIICTELGQSSNDKYYLTR